ncbi:hypothetical protein WJX73_005173 [Symbiochloris irregularis]|uniref:F-box domain-containing protein n=1 Tax=Symbiochloris irregularis TaxID=706552 RepID=A0AAW1Q072_9CHLO
MGSRQSTPAPQWTPASPWTQLPAHIFAKVFSHLLDDDLRAAHLVCQAWSSHLLQHLDHISFDGDPDAAQKLFCSRRLPSLSSISVEGSRGIGWLSGLTKLTSVTISGPATFDSLEPLKDLPKLRKLHLGNVTLTSTTPQFAELTQLRDLALWGVDDSFEHCQIRPPPGLLFCRKLRVLALVGAQAAKVHLPWLSGMTQLEALSLAGSRADGALDNKLRAALSKLRVLDRWELQNVSITGIDPEKDTIDQERLRMFDTFWKAHMDKMPI